MTGEGNLEAASKTLAVNSNEDRNRCADHPQNKPMQRMEHGRALFRKMLVDTRAEAEMRPLGIEDDRAEFRIAEMIGESAVQCRDHGRVDQIGFRPVQTQPKQPTVRLEPDLERDGHDPSPHPFGGFQCRARHHALGQFIAPLRVGRERAPQGDEVDLAARLARTFIEGTEAGARLRHHVEREPGARILLVAIPCLELGLAQLLDGLRRAIGERVEQLGAKRLDLFIEQAEIDGAALHQVLAGLQGVARLRLAERETAVLIGDASRLDQWDWRRIVHPP